MNPIVLLFVSIAFVGIVNSANIPSVVHVCKRNSNAAACIKESVEFIRPHLRKGIKELNLPPLEPFRVPDLILGEKGEPVYVALHDIDVHGASQFQITKLKLDVENLVYRIGVKIPTVKLTGLYDVDVNILVFPILGKGDFDLNSTNIAGNAILRGELYQVNGERKLRFNDLDLKINIGDFSLHLDNASGGGNPELRALVSRIANGSKKAILRIARPLVEEQVTDILLDTANSIAKNFNYDEIFPQV